LSFPRAVWATAFATLIAFMGIGVVDPILPAIARSMGASPPQVEMLFTSYIAVMALAMTVSGWLGTVLGGRRTLLLGLAVVTVFATLSGRADSIAALAGFRAVWGLGNSLFTSTALSLIVGLTTGGLGRAITLYESALGLGIASGPLIGGLLGALSWRYPFYGTAALMGIAFLSTFLTVPEPGRREERRRPGDVFRALADPGVRAVAVAGLFYSYGFFTVLAYSPLYLRLSAHALGAIFFLWGLLVAVTSVLVAPWLRARLGPIRSLRMSVALFAAVTLLLFFVPTAWKVPLIVASGAPIGVNNALFTSYAMEISPFSRSISSAAYNLVRWAGAAVAPWLSGVLALAVSPRLPYLVAGGLSALALVVITGSATLFGQRLRPAEAHL
jgi:ACDE family multidrug resistance protein